MVWDLGTGQAVRTLNGHTNEVNAVAVTMNGRFAISASRDSTVKVWDLDPGNPRPLWCCSITPDGKTILAGDEAGALHILDWRNAPP